MPGLSEGKNQTAALEDDAADATTIPLVLGRWVRNSAMGDRTLGSWISIQAQISSEFLPLFRLRRRIRNDPFLPVRWDLERALVAVEVEPAGEGVRQSIDGL